MRLWSQLLQAWMIHMSNLLNADHTDYQFIWFWLWIISYDAIFIWRQWRTFECSTESSVFYIFPVFSKLNFNVRDCFTASQILSGVGGFVVRLILLFPISCMYLIWLNMYPFYLGGGGSFYLWGLWWCEPCWIFMWVVDWRQLSLPVALFLVLFYQFW